MNRIKSDLSDTIGISFVQSRHGWSDLIIRDGKRELHCRISEVFTCGVTELIRLCNAVFDNRVDAIILKDEPGGHQLAVLPDAAQHDVVTLAAYALTADWKVTATRIFTIRVKRKQLLALLMTELWKLRYLYAEPSFQIDRTIFSHDDALAMLNQKWDADPQLGPSMLK